MNTCSCTALHCIKKAPLSAVLLSFVVPFAVKRTPLKPSIKFIFNGKPAGQRECVAADESARAHRLCKAMGGVQIGNSNSYILQ